MSKNVLVLNMGMKSIRSIVFDDKANKLASASRPLTTGLNENQVFQDTAEWWDCAAKVVRECISSIKYEVIDYITVTTSSSCLVYVDEECQALESCIMVSDKRSEAECAEIAAANAFQHVKIDTNLEVSTSCMLPKILWVKNHQPHIFKQVHKFLSPNDFLIAKMTGQYVTDIFDALKYHYNPQTNSYPGELLRELGIKENTLPKVVDIGTNLGPLSAEAAGHLGLPQSAEVIVTTYDAICSFFGSGVTKEGEASDVSGTVTVLRSLSYKDHLKPSSTVFSMQYPQKKLSVVGGSNNLGGGLIEWTKQCYYNREELPYEMMERDARESAIGAYGIVFLPYLLGERAPVWDNNVRGMFFGLERYHTRKDMTRAVFESTGFIDMDFVNEIEKTGVEINSIRLSGGLARIHLISQIKADITGKEIQVLSEFETTASGAAMMVLEAVGVFADMEEASQTFADIRMIIKPSLKNHVRYQKVYQFYKKIYEDTKDLYLERKSLYQEIYHTKDCKLENL